MTEDIDTTYEWAQDADETDAEITLPEEVREALGEDPLPETDGEGVPYDPELLRPHFTRQTVEHVDPHTLSEHPINAAIYGQLDPPTDLIESIRLGWSKSSILEALPDGTLIKGHLRRHAAMILHLPTVPVIFRDDLTADEDAQVRELLADNAGRLKTNTVRCREWRLALKLFKAEHGAASGEKTRDVVGRQCGVSGVSLEHGVAVIEAIDDRRRDAGIRAQLLSTLDERGIEPAWKLLRAADRQQPADGAQDEAEGGESSEAAAQAIAPAKRLKALRAVLKCLDDNMELLKDIDSLVTAIPRDNWDATMAECQTGAIRLGLIESEIGDRLNAKTGRRKPASRQGRKPTVRG